MPKVYYDNTRLSSYKTCPRMYYFRHIRNWRRDGTALPLTFGLSWHAAMDVIWGLAGKTEDNKVLALAYQKFIDTWTADGLPHPDEMDFETIAQYEPRTPQIAMEMLVEYLNHRKEFITGCDEIIAIEQPFAIPLYPGEDCQHFYIGRIDKKVRKDGRVLNIEHKTTSWYQGRSPNHQFRPDYLDGWSLNSQVDGYCHEGFMSAGKDFEAVYVDAALVHKTTHDVFKFIPVKRSFNALESWLSDARAWVSRVEFDLEMLEATRMEVEDGVPQQEHLSAFPKNTESCQGKFGSKCSYFDLCRYWNNPEQHTLPDEFLEEEWNPFDLLDIAQLEAHKQENSDA